MMPEMDGIALLQAALEIDPNLVGIIMTGEGTIATAVEAMKSGALDYILKPFKLSAILPVLARALAVRRLRLENAALEQQRARTHRPTRSRQQGTWRPFPIPFRTICAPRCGTSAVSPQLLAQSAELPLVGTRTSGIWISSPTPPGAWPSLIDDLLAFSRTGRTDMRQTQRRSPGPAGGSPPGTCSPKSRRATSSGKKIRCPPLQADPALLRQVFINLLLNAVKYTRTRDPAEIEIGCLQKPPEEIVIFVRDNGVGFDMKYADKLFGVFQRLHRQDEFEGTGIGLANVRRIIARHGGRTWAEGKVDGGATFYFTLPDIKAWMRICSN